MNKLILEGKRQAQANGVPGGYDLRNITTINIDFLLGLGLLLHPVGDQNSFLGEQCIKFFLVLKGALSKSFRRTN